MSRGRIRKVLELEFSKPEPGITLGFGCGAGVGGSHHQDRGDRAGWTEAASADRANLLMQESWPMRLWWESL